jgi:hypothetical protein
MEAMNEWVSILICDRLDEEGCLMEKKQKEKGFIIGGCSNL